MSLFKETDSCEIVVIHFTHKTSQQLVNEKNLFKLSMALFQIIISYLFINSYIYGLKAQGLKYNLTEYL